MTGAARWPDWQTDGRDWPHRGASRFVETGGYRWHVQLEGPEDAPALILLHGTGASSHSWRHVMTHLGGAFRLVAPDLPCHGFTRPSGHADLSLPGMVTALAALLRKLDIVPQGLAGHSAGAAIAVKLAGTLFAATPGPEGRFVVGINGAFLPIRGYSLLSPMAKMLFANPLSASMFAALTRHTPLGENLISSTGSRIDAEGAEFYRRLMAHPGHVQGALGMMAAWNLDGFRDVVTRLDTPLTLVAAADDPMVPSANSREMAAAARNGRLVLARTGGHLIHESEPQQVCEWITAAAAKASARVEDAA